MEFVVVAFTAFLERDYVVVGAADGAVEFILGRSELPESSSRVESSLPLRSSRVSVRFRGCC